MDIREINAEIDRLENGDTTYNTCGRLATLYTVRDGLSGQIEPRKMQSGYSYASGDSEFIQAFTAADMSKALSVLDEHMEAIKALYPKEYKAVMRKMLE